VHDASNKSIKPLYTFAKVSTFALVYDADENIYTTVIGLVHFRESDAISNLGMSIKFGNESQIPWRGGAREVDANLSLKFGNESQIWSYPTCLIASPP
jgi:hypothetical protein